MDKDSIECADYLARQNFSAEEINDLHEGKLEFREKDSEE